MFFSDEIKSHSTKELETVIADAVSTLCGHGLECRIGDIDYEHSMTGVKVVLTLSRPLKMPSEWQQEEDPGQ